MKGNNKSFEQNIVTKRFVLAFYELKEKNVFRTQTILCETLGFSVASLTEILKGRRDVNIELLRKFFTVYKVEPSLLFNENKSEPKAITQTKETLRVLEVFNKLKQSDKIKGVDDFSEKMNYCASSFSMVKNGKRNAPHSLQIKVIRTLM